MTDPIVDPAVTRNREVTRSSGVDNDTDAMALIAKWSKLDESEVQKDLRRAYTLAIRASHPSGGGTVSGYFGVREAGRILGIR